MNILELVLKIEVAKAREFLLFELLGKFGDRIPQNLQEDMRREAEFERRTIQKLNKRIEKQVQ